MSNYYNYGSGTYYVTYSTNTTSTWGNWSGYSNNTYGYDYTPFSKRKNYELTHLLRKHDGELNQIKKLKRALGR